MIRVVERETAVAITALFAPKEVGRIAIGGGAAYVARSRQRSWEPARCRRYEILGAAKPRCMAKASERLFHPSACDFVLARERLLALGLAPGTPASDFVERRKVDFADAAKLDFLDREKRILLVAFSRKWVDVRGEEVDVSPQDSDDTFGRRGGRIAIGDKVQFTFTVKHG